MSSLPTVLLVLAAAVPLAAQSRGAAPAGESKPKPSAVAERATPVGNVQFDAGGWPILPEDPLPGAGGAASPTPKPAAPSPKPATGADPAAGSKPPAGDPAPPARAAAPPDAEARAIASGMQLGSPLLDVFRTTQAPAALRGLGGVTAWWRVTIHGPNGEQIGVRELTHTADLAFAERDRLELGDGRVYARVGAQVYAARAGLPLPAQTEQAGHELALYGLHLRCPWAFGDANAWAVNAQDVQDRSGERLRRIVLQRRPPPALDILGPELDPAPRDACELLFEPSSGWPRELVHRFAASRETRRVLLEDWREEEGVPMAHRRVYVDEALRSTTVLELQRVVRQRVTERDFRLH
jgi:hypothetical protein